MKAVLRKSHEFAVKATVESLGYVCERADEQQFNGAEAKQSIAKVLAALKNKPLPLITNFLPGRMPDDSFVLLSAQKLTEYRGSTEYSLKTAIRRLLT